MSALERIPLTVKILLPLLLALLLQVSPLARLVTEKHAAAEMARQNGYYAAAADALSVIIEHEPWRADMWEEIGVMNFLAGRTSEAIHSFQTAEQADMLSADGRFSLAEAYFLNGQDAQAEAIWQAALRTDGPTARIFDRLVLVQRKNGDFAAAAETLQHWRSVDPQNIRLTYLNGLLLSVLHPDQAAPLLIEAAQQDSQYSPSVQTLRKSLALAESAQDPAYAWLLIGRALGSLEQWDLAEQAFLHATQLSPQYAEAWAFLGEAQGHLGRSGKAELDRALTLDPKSAVVQALLAFYYGRQGAPDQALPYLQAITIADPQEPYWQVELGATLAKTGDLHAAQQAFQTAVALAPKDTRFWQYLAWFAMQYNMDLHGLALPAARQAVMLAPNDPSALDTMGWAMLSLNDSASAERFFQAAFHQDATYAPVNLHLGQLFLQRQDVARARPYLERAAALGDNDPTASTARRLLQQYGITNNAP